MRANGSWIALLLALAWGGPLAGQENEGAEVWLYVQNSTEFGMRSLTVRVQSTIRAESGGLTLTLMAGPSDIECFNDGPIWPYEEPADLGGMECLTVDAPSIARITGARLSLLGVLNDVAFRCRRSERSSATQLVYACNRRR